MTNCPPDEILLASLHSDEVVRHAESCPHCSELRAVWLALDEWKPQQISEGFNRELWRRIDAEPAPRGWFAGFWKPAISVAAGLAIATVVIYERSPKVPAPSSPLAISAADADQLEHALDDIQLLHDVDAIPAAAKPATGAL